MVVTPYVGMAQKQDGSSNGCITELLYGDKSARFYASLSTCLSFHTLGTLFCGLEQGQASGSGPSSPSIIFTSQNTKGQLCRIAHSLTYGVLVLPLTPNVASSKCSLSAQFIKRSSSLKQVVMMDHDKKFGSWQCCVMMS